MIPKSGANFGEKLILCFKNDKNLLNFDLSTKKSKKVALWLVPFAQSIQRSTLKSTGELYFMILKSHAKFQKKLTCGLENDMRNLANFHQNTWKCQNWYFHGILLFKVENAWATNYMSYRGVISKDTEEWRKIWREIDLPFQNWLEEFDEFWKLESLKNLHFHGLLLTKLCHVSWQWKFDEFWLEHLKISKVCTLMDYRWVLLDGIEYWCNVWRTDLCFQKLHERFSKFSPEHVQKCKNWDFDGILLSKVENAWA